MEAAIVETLRQPIGAWQQGEAPTADVAVSSRVRLARNLADLPFGPRMSPADAGALLQRTAAAARALPPELGAFTLTPMAEFTPLDRQVLVEKHLISRQLAAEGRGGLLVRSDEQLSAMVLEEDHLRLQALFPGLQLPAAWELASRFDDALERTMDWAFSPELGYLTTCPTNLGTAMRVSVMLHLPGLCWTNRVEALLAGLGAVGVTARGLYGEGSSAEGNLFQISNQTSLGQGEAEVVGHLEAVAREVVARERSAREALLAERRAAVEDRVWRAYGILAHARLLSSGEALRLLSDLRLGADLHILPTVPAEGWAELLVLTRRGFLQRQEGGATPERRDAQRAQTVRSRLETILTPPAAGGDAGGAEPSH